MKHKPCLDLQDIKAIAQAAEAHATARGWAVSIAIAMTAATCCGCSAWMAPAPASAHIAPAKAHAAALGRKESRLYEEMINGGRTAYLSVPALQGLLEGGVPITSEGHCLGAVGVSGEAGRGCGGGAGRRCGAGGRAAAVAALGFSATCAAAGPRRAAWPARHRACGAGG
ncbi:hypothetical protein CTI10_010285 [Delftia acidovorans]|nr:hypothetical protein CTI10_010285 [Delftia acidovorans]